MQTCDSQSQEHPTTRTPGEGLLEATSAMYIIVGSVIMIAAAFAGFRALNTTIRTINSSGLGLFLFRPHVIRAALVAIVSAGGAFLAGVLGFKRMPNHSMLLVALGALSHSALLVALGAFNIPLLQAVLVRELGLSAFPGNYSDLRNIYNLILLASAVISFLFLTGAIKNRNYHIRTQPPNEVNHV